MNEKIMFEMIASIARAVQDKQTNLVKLADSTAIQLHARAKLFDNTSKYFH